MFDKDSDKKWSVGDWLILEGGTLDGVYTEGTDTVIIQGSGTVADGAAANFRLFHDGSRLNIVFHDLSNDSLWQSGEDIVADIVRNRTFDGNNPNP